jgi:hypothetical protein
MTSPPENLRVPGNPRHKKPPDATECFSPKRFALARSTDSANKNSPLQSRFDGGYNAAHGLCFAASRSDGWLANRYIGSQVQPHTLVGIF